MFASNLLRHPKACPLSGQSEAMLVFIGGVCVANLLTFLFGASTLLAAGP